MLGVSTLASFMFAFAEADTPKARDLSSYDLAGPFCLDRSPRHGDEQAPLRALMRQFLWTRWQRHRLAHMAVVQYTLEGLPTRIWYFIEPGEHDVWHVVIDQDETLPAFKANSDEHLREAHHYEAYSLERVEVTDTSPEDSDRRIPDNETREPETYRLRLKGRDGQTIREL